MKISNFYVTIISINYNKCVRLIVICYREWGKYYGSTGIPRSFVNFSLDMIGIQEILKLMEDKENRKCAFNECLAYHNGKKYIIFMENRLSIKIL